MLSPERLQTYIRKAAALTHDVVEAPPFSLFFNPGEDLRFYNYGVPVEAVSCLPDGALASLRAVFAERNRLLRFEFIQEAAPDLASALASAGLAEEGRNPLLVCTPDSLRPTAEVPGLAICRLTPESPRRTWPRSSACKGGASAKKNESNPLTRRWKICAGVPGRGATIFSACWMTARSLRANRAARRVHRAGGGRDAGGIPSPRRRGRAHRSDGPGRLSGRSPGRVPVRRR